MTDNSEKQEAWNEIGGGTISDSELLDSMDGGLEPNSRAKSMLSQQSSRRAPPSEIETSTLYREKTRPSSNQISYNKKASFSLTNKRETSKKVGALAAIKSANLIERAPYYSI